MRISTTAPWENLDTLNTFYSANCLEKKTVRVSANIVQPSFLHVNSYSSTYYFELYFVTFDLSVINKPDINNLVCFRYLTIFCNGQLQSASRSNFELFHIEYKSTKRTSKLINSCYQHSILKFSYWVIDMNHCFVFSL